MDYFQKINHKPTPDLTWNLPEKKQGTINIIGGNSQSFQTEVKIAEYTSKKYPVKNVNLVFPDSLKSHLPPLPNFVFLSSTDSGSLADAAELQNQFNSADYNLILGDLSKNAITSKAVLNASARSEKPLLITRDAIDLIIEASPEKLLQNDNLILFGSVIQLQKILRAIYYPKMLLLSQSLVQVADILHKFTLSYSAKIITLHNEQILIAENGEVKAIPLAKSGYTPLVFWNGELASKIAVLNLFNPNNFQNATISAFFA